jgi:hypothetical protein
VSDRCPTLLARAAKSTWSTPRTDPENMKPFCRLTIAVALLAAEATTSNAQMGGAPMGTFPMGGGHGGRQRNQQQAPAHTVSPPPPPVAPEPWPRLDSGAILCKSRDDLVRYQTQGTADPSDAASRQAPDCMPIQKRIAIKILDRDGPSRTHVAATDTPEQSGWTNAYLPSKQPTSTTTSAISGR